MKSIFFTAVMGFLVLMASCNNVNEKNEHEGHDTATTNASAGDHATPNKSEVKTLTVVYKDIDADASAALKKIVDQYLLVKNALFNDKSAEASAAAKGLVEATSKLDKSLLSTQQKTSFDSIEKGLKEHAGFIAKANDLKVQREHFDELSNSVYELAKTFGAGRPLYHDHCPMANNNQGAMWISENKEITNPYFGAAMPNCGTVQEEIQ